MLQILRSMSPLTEFAPTWQIPMWTAVYPNTQNIDYMRDWIIDNEQAIKEKYADQVSRNDGGTGLGLDSLTAQYNKFNLFTETSNIEAFQDLRKFIAHEYRSFMKELGATVRDCYLYSWANVMTTGQTVGRHHHGASHYAYLSGNMHFDNYQTLTTYYNPYGEVHYDYVNKKGGMTFFPSYLLHETNQHLENFKRVSMAFDLFDKDHLQDHDPNRIDLDAN